MSKITEVMYEKVNEDVYSKEDVGNFYWFHNIVSIDPNSFESYENYKLKHLETRNKLIEDNIPYNKTPLLNTAFFAISTIDDQPIIVVDIQ